MHYQLSICCINPALDVVNRRLLVAELVLLVDFSNLLLGLWDEIRVETLLSTLVENSVTSGTPAPMLPHNVRLISHEAYDGNVREFILHLNRIMAHIPLNVCTSQENVFFNVMV